MSEQAVPISISQPAQPSGKSFVAHAKLIAGLTLLSRILGMARDSVSANYLGTGLVASAFTFAFMIPNLFRKLFGEGALSAAFIPLYSQSLKHENAEQAQRFAAASVNLLCLLLLALTITGELVLLAIALLTDDLRPERQLTLILTAIMLPYLLLICGAAFLSAILQVHKRFGAPAFAPVLLNVCHIAVLGIGGYLLGLRYEDGQRLVELQTTLAYWLAAFVLVAGALQVMILMPALREIGFRFQWISAFWTPGVKKMLRLSIPVAIGAGVLQLSVLIDKGLSFFLAAGVDDAGNAITHFTFLGQSVRYPMEMGAIVRLSWAQLLYQFPLGVFAIAIATAIFPSLSAEALDSDRHRFRDVLRHGIEVTLLEGFAASIGLIIVAYPAVVLLFQHGQANSDHITMLTARSLMFYSIAIWAFSLQQILNRAYYALHDTTTPLVMSIVTLIVNLLVEIPLLWTPLAESGMAAGTAVSFSLQGIVMLIMLDRRVGGIGLSQIGKSAAKMIVAAALMWLACWGVQQLPFYPTGEGKTVAAIQLIVLMAVGAIVYLSTCAVLGIRVSDVLKLKRAMK